MTQQQRRDSGGSDEDTGIWTAVLSTLTALTVGGVYIAQVTNSGAVPESQEREFQFGGAEGIAAPGQGGALQSTRLQLCGSGGRDL